MEEAVSWNITSLNVGDCLFWFMENREEQRSILIPYLSQGVARGEKLLILRSKTFFQSSLAEEIRSRLDEEGMPATGQLAAFILSESESGARGIGDPEEFVQVLRVESDRALNEGYPAVRILVEADALIQKCQTAARLTGLLRDIDQFFAASRCLGMFTLEPSRIDPVSMSLLLVSQRRIGIGRQVTSNHLTVPLERLQSEGDLASALLYRVGNADLMTSPAAASQGGPDAYDVYRDVFKGLPGFAAILDSQGIIREVNRSGMEMLGRQAEKLIGLPIWDFPAWKGLNEAEICTAVEKARSGGTGRVEVRLREKKRERLTLELVFTCISAAGEASGCILCTAHDQTAITALSQRLEARDQIIASAGEVAPLVLFWIDRAGLIRYSSSGFGKESAAKGGKGVVGRSIYSAYADIPEFHRDFERALMGETFSTRLEVEGATYEVRYMPALDDQGGIRGVAGCGLEISHQLWTEDALYRSQTQMQVVMDDSPVGITLIDLETRKARMNPALLKMLGYEPDELTRMDLLRLVSPEDLPEAIQAAEALEKGDISQYNGELRMLRKDNQVIWVRQSVTRYEGTGGNPPFVVGLYEDITQRKQAEENLKRQVDLVFRVLESTPIGIWITDPQGKLVSANPAAEAIWGDSQALNLDGLGSVHAVFAETGKPLGTEDWALSQVLRSGKPALGNLVDIILPDGSVRTVINSAFPIFNPDQDFIAAVSVFQDITDQKQVEKELTEVQRQLLVKSEAERLSLAQDLHDGPIQDLYGITFQLHELDEALAHTEFEPVAKSIIDTVQQVIAVLRTMCTEMRPPTLAPFGLEKAIRSHAESYQRRHPDLHVQIDLDPDGQKLPENVRLGLFRIYQELLNNVVRHANASRVEIRFRLKQDQAELEVEDNGSGFEVPRRWVEIVRQGHYGLVGLQERAEALGGWVKIVSAAGQGTRVHVGVPRVQPGTSPAVFSEAQKKLESQSGANKSGPGR